MSRTWLTALQALASCLMRRLFAHSLPARACAVGLCLFTAASAQAAPAQTPAVDTGTACPRGNLLAHAQPLTTGLPKASLGLLTDRVVAREGSPWPSPSVVAVIPGDIAFDLGSIVPLQQVYLQIDADQSFAIDLSTDGVDWTRLPVSASQKASGLISRNFKLGSAQARFVKLVATATPATLTVTEIAVFCQSEDKVRRGFVVDGTPRDSLSSSWFPGLLTATTGLPAISPDGANIVKLVLVVLSGLLIGLELRRRRSAATDSPRTSATTVPGQARAHRYLDLAWGLIAATAVGAYLNFGAYRYPEFVHDHDVFHYFVGAKYFPELGYEDIYACSAVAEAEAGFSQRVQLRSQRDLKTNRLVSGTFALTHGPRCRERFAERWRDFRHDVAYFADGRSVEDWHRVLKDHGFNASPTWIALGRMLSGHLPANEQTIGHRNALFAGFVGPIDPLLLLASAAAVLWAFGLRTAAIVAVVFACNPLSEFAWVGGGFLREAWLAALVVGVCLIKKERYVLGGASLALAALLQLFPLVTLAVPVFGAASSAWAIARRVDARSKEGWAATALAWRRALWSQRQLWRMLGGAGLALLLLVPLSGAAAGGNRVWSAFAANTAKHERTPSGNLVGLASLLSFRPSTNVDVTFDASSDDPFARARAARLATRSSMRPIQGLVVLVALGLLAVGLRRKQELWWTAALGLCVVPLTIETSCYYSAWFCAFALIGHGRERLFLPILAAVVALLATKLISTRLGVDAAVASAILVLTAFTVLALSAREQSHRARQHVG